MNLAIVVGRLTSDPDLVTLSSGKMKVEFGIATNEYRKGQQAVEFHNCVAWDRLAETIGKYGRKGRMLECIGRLATKTYTNRAGQEVKRTEIHVHTMNFVDSGKRDQEPEQTAWARSAPEPESQTGW